MDNISLIGFMGSGKSAVGKRLATKIGKKFIDLDEVIEAVENKNIYRIIKEKGEQYFRDVESEVIKKIYINDGYVFACGGGAILREENIEIIRQRSKVVYLYITPQTAIKRLIGSKNRPLLDVKDRKKEIIRLLKIRELEYQNAADLTVDNNRSVNDTVFEIIKEIG